MAKILPPKIDGKDSKGKWKADIDAMKLGLPSNYYTYNPQAYTDSAKSKCDKGSDAGCKPTKNKNSNEYWIVRNHQTCPNCGEIHMIDDATNLKYLHEKRVVTLKHCYRKPSEDGKMQEIVPTTLHILTFQRTCPSCKKLYRDSINDLRYKRKITLEDGTKKEVVTQYAITNDLGNHIRKASLKSDFNTLSETFGISIRIIQKLYSEEVDSKDQEMRTIPQPEFLGLYTMEFKDFDEKGKTTQYCLCVDEKRQTFVGFFPWNKAALKKAFFDSIPDTSKVENVFINLDDKAARECGNIFKKARIIVERRDVLRRSRNAATEVYADAKNRYPQYKSELLKYRDELLLPDEETYYYNKDIISQWYKAMPTVKDSCDLHNTIELMYNQDEARWAALELEDWMKVDKSEMPPEQALEELLKRHQKSVLDFITLYGAMDKTSRERKAYENLLDAVERPIERVDSEGIRDTYPMRHAGWKYLYGHVMYGVMAKVNQRHLEESIRQENGGVFTYKLTAENFMTPSLFMQRWTETHPQYVTFDNFSIPLQEMYDALIDMFENPLPREPLIPICFAP